MVLLAFIHSSAHSVEKGCKLGGQENENDMVVQTRSHFLFMRKQMVSYNESDRNGLLQDLAILFGNYSRRFAKLSMMTFFSCSRVIYIMT